MTEPARILILDDERDAADMLSELLALYFAEASITVVYTGEDAVTAAAAHRPDVAIFDLEMTGLDGEGAARALHSRLPDSRPLLIALSGNVLRLSELRGSGVFDHLLSKPVDLEALVQMLQFKR